MKEIVIISGKGGTGKTSLTASFAALAHDPVLADCDVDAADLFLVFPPDVRHEEEFSGGSQARVDPELCIGCGLCAELCRFGAVQEQGDVYRVDPLGCEGCGVCAHFCPQEAILFEPVVNGRWFISDTRVGPMVHARLGAGEENSGKLVTLVKREALRVAAEENRDLVIVDGSPGIGCPVIASISGADLVVVVSEPTVSGVHDLERVLDLTAHFRVPAAVCINKHDLNEEMSDKLVALARDRGAELAGRIPYDDDFTAAQIAGQSLVEHGGAAADDIRHTWEQICSLLD